MTDQKMIASMVGDFYGVYLGKSMLGIQGLLKKYHNHKFIITLISNLETTVEIDMHKAMHEIYDFYKKHRGKGQREDSEWEQIIEEASKIGKKYEGNAWCKQFLIQMISIIEEEDTEIRAKREELEKSGMMGRGIPLPAFIGGNRNAWKNDRKYKRFEYGCRPFKSKRRNFTFAGAL